MKEAQEQKVLIKVFLFCCQKDSVYKDMKKRKDTNPHVLEAETNRCLVFLFDKSSIK